MRERVDWRKLSAGRGYAGRQEGFLRLRDVDIHNQRVYPDEELYRTGKGSRMSIYIIETKREGKWQGLTSDYYETHGEAEAEKSICESFYKQDKFRVQEYVRPGKDFWKVGG